MNILDDYSDYILETRYYIIWYFDSNNIYEEGVSVEKFVKAINNLNKYNNFPFSVKCKYFVKYDGIDFIEISKEVYKELYKWQYNAKMHEIYEWRKHRDKYKKFDLYTISDPFSIENQIINEIDDEELKNFLKMVLSKHQYEIVYSLIFEKKKKVEIAREKHISRQAINNSIKGIRKKLKKIFEIIFTFCFLVT